MGIVRFFRNSGAFVGSIVLLIMRLYWGYQFFQIGWIKLGDLASVEAMFEDLGIIYPVAMSQLVAYVETIGGLCLVFGFLSRLAAIPLIITMLTAYMTAHFDAVLVIFTNPDVFMDQKPFMFLLTSLFVFSYGAGFFSLDYYFTRRPRRKAVEEEAE